MKSSKRTFWSFVLLWTFQERNSCGREADRQRRSKGREQNAATAAIGREVSFASGGRTLFYLQSNPERGAQKPRRKQNGRAYNGQYPMDRDSD
jgi:hypothetical protein